MSERGELLDLYFISDVRRRYVKIGVSNNCERRLNDLQAANPTRLGIDAIVPNGGKALEKALHQYFARHWVHREWFRYAEPVKEIVARIQVGAAWGIPAAPYPNGMYDVHGCWMGYEATLRALKKGAA